MKKLLRVIIRISLTRDGSALFVELGDVARREGAVVDVAIHILVDFLFEKSIMACITNGKDYPPRFRPCGAFSFYTLTSLVNHS